MIAMRLEAAGDRYDYPDVMVVCTPVGSFAKRPTSSVHYLDPARGTAMPPTVPSRGMITSGSREPPRGSAYHWTQAGCCGYSTKYHSIRQDRRVVANDRPASRVRP